MNPFGRPRQYETPEELEAVIVEYFQGLEEEKLWPSVTGLCLALNLSRQGLINYQERPEFVDTIKRAKLMVEFAIEQQLMQGRNAAGPIFNLKNNFGWKDERTNNIEGGLDIGVREVNVSGTSAKDA